MSDSDKVVVLPSAEEMQKRLASVNDDPHLKERFYPILLEKAGRELYAAGVNLMLALAIDDYVKGNGLPPIVGNVLILEMPRYIDALVDDKEVAEEAKSLLPKH